MSESKKNKKNSEEGGSQTPQIVANVFFCRLDESPAAFAAGRHVVVVIARDKVAEPNMSIHVRMILAHQRRMI